MKTIQMKILMGEFSVCKLPPASPIPEWATQGGAFSTLSLTDKEVSITVLSERIPKDFPGEIQGEWRCMEVQGPLDFSLTGILSQIALPLANEKISIFAISTYDTDYVMVKEGLLKSAKASLKNQGIQFVT